MTQLITYTIIGAALTGTPAALAHDVAVGDSEIVLPWLWYLAPAGALIALVMAFVFYRGFMKSSEGDDNMVRIAQAVRKGAYAYLKSQAKVVYLAIGVLVLVLMGIGFAGLQSKLTWIGFAAAASLSGLCGFLGMKTATNASARTTHATKESLNAGLKIAFRAGAVMGLCVTGFALLDISVWFFVLTQVFIRTSEILRTALPKCSTRY